jgi:hypothetical protein
VPDRASPLASLQRLAPRHAGPPDRDAYDEALVGVPLDEKWTAYYRVVPQGGELVVAEIRVLPIPEAGDWPSRKLPRYSDEEEWVLASIESSKKGTPPKVPRGGLTARGLRSGLRLTDAIQKARRLLLDALEQSVIDPEMTRFTRVMLKKDPPGTGRRGRDDLHYAKIALLYVDKLARGSRRPVADVADDLAIHRDKAGAVSQAVHEARRRGLLTKSPRGRPGGELTAKAEAILAEAKAEQ